MTVYVVTVSYEDGMTDLVGVYSTRQLAEQARLKEAAEQTSDNSDKTVEISIYSAQLDDKPESPLSGERGGT